MSLWAVGAGLAIYRQSEGLLFCRSWGCDTEKEIGQDVPNDKEKVL